jgi:hypothetical protein
MGARSIFASAYAFGRLYQIEARLGWVLNEAFQED